METDMSTAAPSVSAFCENAGAGGPQGGPPGVTQQNAQGPAPPPPAGPPPPALPPPPGPPPTHLQ
eukprot:455924-Lingulodinium_polyedra.AAC.1